jgi:hypothetical protein
MLQRCVVVLLHALDFMLHILVIFFLASTKSSLTTNQQSSSSGRVLSVSVRRRTNEIETITNYGSLPDNINLIVLLDGLHIHRFSVRDDTFKVAQEVTSLSIGGTSSAGVAGLRCRERGSDYRSQGSRYSKGTNKLLVLFFS